MASSGSEDHPQVQAASTGPAVCGDPPSLAAACLLPPSPSASNAAIQPRARESAFSDSSGCPDNPPRSTATRHAGERPSDDEDNHSRLLDHFAASSDNSEAFGEVPLPTATTHSDTLLPPLTSFAATADNHDSPAPPAQIVANFEGIDTAMRESMNMPEATPVQDPPEIPVYNAVQVVEQTGLKRNKKIIIALGVGLLIGTAVTAGVSVRSNNGSSGITVLSTALPSKSSSPSQLPSLRPTLRPSQSTNPSQSPSRSPLPSLSPSISASPTPFCVDGEINIRTDSYPEETHWTISRIDNVDGIANPTVVLEGSPEKKDHHTSDEVCLERGDYEFAIFDRLGDGISNPGHYNVTFDGLVIAQGGGFESEETVSFSLPLPSPQPSESSSPSKFPSASFQPSESIIPSQSLTPSLQPSNSFSPSTYWSSLKWIRQGTGFNGDSTDDFFGEAVEFSADALIMAVGAPKRVEAPVDTAAYNRLGYVKVFHRKGEGSSWEQRGDTIRGEAYGDDFGNSLSLSDDGLTLSVGADSGQVKVFKWNEGALNYVQIGDTLYVGTYGDQLGSSLDISLSSNGKILAVGARYSNANGYYSGQVAVYTWDDASTNFKQRGQVIDGDAAWDQFGYSISLAENGQKLAIGANRHDSNVSDAGQVRVYGWDEPTSNYVQLGDSLLGDAAGDLFGSSVSFSRDGTALAIGAPNNGENGQYAGKVKVFAWDEGTSNFKQIGQSLFGKAPGDYFGLSVALAEDRTLAVGAPQSGYVEVYGWDEAFLEYKRIGQSLGGEASDLFGNALALARNGRVLAVGAPQNDKHGTSSGQVEVFGIEL